MSARNYYTNLLSIHHRSVLSLSNLAKLLIQVTYATPTVRASLGTRVRSPPKNLALAIIVSYANVLTLVLEVKEEPGSLKAICPSGPMPKRKSILEKIMHYFIFYFTAQE